MPFGTVAREIAIGDNHPNLFDSASGSIFIFVLGQILVLNPLSRPSCTADHNSIEG